MRNYADLYQLIQGLLRITKKNPKIALKMTFDFLIFHKFEMIRPILAQSFLLRESYSITKIERSPTHALEKFP